MWNPWSLIFLLRFFTAAHAAPDLCPSAILHTTVETSEIEAKYLVPRLEFDPDIERALLEGVVTPRVPQRGFVVQQYLEPSVDHLRRVFAALDALGVPFGTEDERARFLEPGVAKEIRLMSGSILRREGRLETRQVTIKGAGGVAITQLESPRDVSADQRLGLAKLFADLHPLVIGSARKIYFEVAREDGLVTEIDVFIGASGVGAPPIFANGEVEFHGSDALVKAANFRADVASRPPFLSTDLTDEPRLKSRDIALGGVPAEIEAALKPHRAANHAFVERLAREYSRWADPVLAAEVLYPKVAIDVEMIDPRVFAPTEDEAIRAHFGSEGYVVVDHVSRPEDREHLVDLMARIAQSEPRARRLGFMDLYHDDTLARLRQSPELHRVFANLFGTERLWAVFDRVMYWRQDEPDLPLPPHVDQNPRTHPDFFAAQGMLALRDMDEGTGTLVVAPGSHLGFGAYAPWARDGAGFVEWRGRAPWVYRGVRLKAGQIVIWDSRVTHGRVRHEPKGDRFAALLTFTPAVDDEALRFKRVDRFERGVGESDHAAGLRATARPRWETSLRETKEDLSELGRRLYGVTSWFASP